MIKASTLLCCLLSLMLILLERCATAQFIPPIPCTQYFQYQKYGSIYIGKVTIPNVSGTTQLDIEFSQPQSLQTSYYGSVSLYQDQDTTLSNIQAGLPVSYRVDFPIPENPPKLTQIAVNGNLICAGSAYSPPNTMIKLQHTLETSTRRVFLPSGGSFPVFTPAPPPPTAPPTPPPPPPTPRATPPPTRRTSFAPNITTSYINNICGQEGRISFTPFVVGGTMLNRGQFPWLTAIYQKLPANTKFICGGSLISARTIITAAHCFTLTSLTAQHVVVYVGRYKLDDFSERGFEVRELRELMINPEYDSNRYPDADIAILQMKSAVEFTEYIRPICLWSTQTSVTGRTGVTAGWGSDELGNEVSPVPKMVEANIVSDSECLRSDEGFAGLTSDRTLCAGNRDGTGPCKGDSGGGLMINQNNRWLLRGIVSAGQSQNRQCDLHQYVIYCDLSKHLTWIQNNIVN